MDTKGHIKWPKTGDGFVLDGAGNPITEPAHLKAGQLVDRYGSSGGRFTSPIIDGEVTPFNKRGLPYPESYQPYHRYEVVMDITEENIVKAFNGAPIELQNAIKSKLSDFNLTVNDLADIRKGEIAKVFGQGGGMQNQFKSGIDIYEKLGLLKEVIK
nr:TNT domain-containing protein [Streptococcus acidominimus]